MYKLSNAQQSCVPATALSSEPFHFFAIGFLEVGLGVLEARLGVLEAGLGVLEAGLGVLEAGLGVMEAGLRRLGGRTGCLGGWAGRLGAIQTLPEAPESTGRLTGSVGKRKVWIFEGFARFLGGAPHGRANPRAAWSGPLNHSKLQLPQATYHFPLRSDHFDRRRPRGSTI